MSILGERIIELRKEKQLTQDQLAKYLSVNRATLSNWEIGRALPDVNMLVALADFFDVKTDYLLGRDDNPSGHMKLDKAVSDELPNEALMEIEEFKKYIRFKYKRKK